MNEMANRDLTLRNGDTACSIDDYAVIGDCRSAALISITGSVDWLCWPCFDSPSIFASLLDRDKGGSWQLCPTGSFRSSQRYLERTNILETRFQTGSGTLLLVDFMPVAEEEYKRSHMAPDHEVIRILTCVEGNVEIRISLTPRPGYGAEEARFADRGKLGIRLDTRAGLLTLHSNLSFVTTLDSATTTVSLAQGETIPLILTFSHESPQVLPLLAEAGAALERTKQWWVEWASRCTYNGPYIKEVLRSLLTLKLLEFSASGAFVAAVTTSLPEKVGGRLNWDYRYCWLRDASLVIEALCETGYPMEAEAFSEWMLHATRLTQPKLRVMYDLYGNVVEGEKELQHLAGYLGSQPVHIGNAAHTQVQLDTYGEVICGAAKVIHCVGHVDKETAKVLTGFGKYVCKHWREADAGIWEPRGKPAVHTHSRLLCWVALQELILLHEDGFLNIRPIEEFRKTRALIRQDIEANSWDAELDSYTSEPGNQALDATLLLMAWHGFHPASSPRALKTYERVQQKLDAGGGLLYRYRQSPELEEGAFGICSFWAAEHLAMGSGSLQVAKDCFEKLLSYGNALGLYAEEVDPSNGSSVGNFPQAFTHVGLINAALAIQRREQSEANSGRGERMFVEQMR